MVLLIGIFAAVELSRAWLLLLAVLLAMILAYHATDCIIDFLQLDTDSSLVWALIYVPLLVAPVLAVVLYRVRKSRNSVA
jgi:uncharacterized BrkB/YihY/UPF0761 family membrane protein